MPSSRTLRQALLGLAVAVALGALAAAVEPRCGELVVLRWMRSVADHPFRCATAVALLARAASGAPGASGAHGTGGAPGDGGTARNDAATTAREPADSQETSGVPLW